MSRERIDDETLAAYLDGELGPAEADRVRAALEGDPALEAEVAWHTRVGDIVRASDPELEGRLGSPRDSDELFARIEGALATHSAAETASARNEARPPRPALVPRHRSRVFAATTSVLLAAAAALVLVLRPAPASERPSNGIGTSPTDVPRGSEILDVDFGKSTGTTFSVEGTHGEPLAVVWISDSVLEE